jgi:hypothetical protein
MKHLLSIAAVATALNVAGAAAAELPNYELMGYPITSHQVAILGSANVQERSPIPMLSLNGMPASPHQVAVLTPRRGVTAAIATQLTTAGLSAH